MFCCSHRMCHRKHTHMRLHRAIHMTSTSLPTRHLLLMITRSSPSACHVDDERCAGRLRCISLWVAFEVPRGRQDGQPTRTKEIHGSKSIRIARTTKTLEGLLGQWSLANRQLHFIYTLLSPWPPLVAMHRSL